MTKIRKHLSAFFACMLACFMVFGISEGLLQSSYAAEPEDAQTADGCLITIDNGAASANTDYAVNGLHVYDPDSEELDDFVSGAEVPKGSLVTVYVYNLASPVMLTIEHNNETVVKKRFETMEAWVDDDKVEFFEFTLEGDLKVTTEALPEEEPEDAAEQYTVHLENGNLATVSSNGALLTEGSRIPAGVSTFEVATGSRDAELTLSMLEEEAPERTYTVSTVNPLENQGVSVLAAYQEEGSEETEIASGDQLPENTRVSLNVQNESGKEISVTAAIDGTVVNYERLGETDGWSLEQSLQGNMTIIVSDLSSAEELTHTVSLVDDAERMDAAGKTNKLLVSAAGEDGKAAPEITDGMSVENGSSISVCMNNYADDVVVSVIQNGEVVREESLDVLAEGEAREPFDLTVEGDLIILTRIQDEASINQTRTVILDGAKLDANSSYTISDVPVKGDLYFHFTAQGEPETYPVTVENHTSQQMTVGYADDSSGVPVAVDIVSGQSYEAGLMIGARGINTLTDRTLVLSAYVGGGLVDQVIIDPMKGTLEGANGFYITLEGPARFVLDYGESVIPEPEPEPVPEDNRCKVTVKNKAAKANTDYAVNGLHVYDTTSLEDISGSQIFAKGTEIEIYVYNCASPVHLKVVHNGEVIVDKDYAQMEAWVDDEKVEFIKVKLEGDLAVTATVPGDSDDSCILRITGNKTGKVSSTDGKTVYSNGAVLDKGTYDFSVSPDPEVDLKATVTVGNKKAAEAVIPAGNNSHVFKKVKVDGDITFAFETVEKPEPEEKTFTVTAVNQLSAEGVDVNLSWLDLSGEMPKSIPVASGDSVKENTGIYVQVVNDSDKAITVTAAIGGETLESAEIEAGGAGGLMGEDFSGLSLTGDMTVTVAAAEASPVLHIEGEKTGWIYPLDGYNDYADGAELEKDEIYDFTVYGNEDVDVKVTVKVGDEIIDSAEIPAGYNFHNFTGIKALADITFVYEEIKEPEEKTFTVTAVNPLSAEGVNVNLSWLDLSGEMPKSIPVASGDSVKEKTGIYVQVINDSSKAVTVTAAIGGEILESTEIEAGGAGGLMGEDFSGLSLTGDMTVTVAEKQAEPEPEPEPEPETEKTTCTVTVNNGAASANTDDTVNGLHVYDTTSYDDINGSVSFEKGTEIEIYVYNCASPVHLQVVHNGQVIADKDYDQMEAWVDDDKVEFIKVKLEGDLTVTTTVAEAPAGLFSVDKKPAESETRAQVTEAKTKKEEKGTDVQIAETEPAEEPESPAQTEEEPETTEPETAAPETKEASETPDAGAPEETEEPETTGSES